MPVLYLKKRIPARNQKRFYTITVTRTLFDGWAVVREWGRIGQPGTVRETGFETETAAIALLYDLWIRYFRQSQYR
jgi:predicted DNA-binding WGR domain protein